MNYRIVLGLLTSLSCAALSAQDVVIQNVQVETGDGQTLKGARVVITDGLIISVAEQGENAVPEGHRVIDGAGKVLTPGLVETQSQVGLSDIMFDQDESDSAYRGLRLTPAFRAAEGYNPSSNWIPIQRAAGVTSVVLSPLGGMISGTGSWMDLTAKLEVPQTTPAQMSADFDAAGRSASGQSRGGMWLRLREILDDARYYLKNKGAYDKGQMRATTMSDMNMAAMSSVLKGEIPLVVKVHRASDILQTLAFAKEQNIRVVLSGASESWRVADAIKKANVSVILQPSIQAPFGFQALFARDDVATLLHAAGVDVIITAGIERDQNIRRLRQEAGIAVAHGLPWQSALSSITQGPAQAFGRTDIGTVAEGKRGTVVLWSGDPLELSTRAQVVLIDGVEYSTNNRQRMLAKKYLKRVKKAKPKKPTSVEPKTAAPKKPKAQ